MELATCFTEAPLRMLKWEGVTVRSDALATIHLVRDSAMTANQVARARNCSAGSASNTLRRLVSVGILETVGLPPSPSKFAKHCGPLTGYRCTDKGKRLLESAPLMLDEMQEQDDPEASWPKPNTDTLVRNAMLAQPCSVFDLGRARMAAANDSHMRRGAFAIA